jgi:hypothetical protein
LVFLHTRIEAMHPIPKQQMLVDNVSEFGVKRN